LLETKNFKISSLGCDNDWQNCKAALVELDRKSRANPWANWHHFHFVSSEILNNCCYFLIEIYDAGELIAATVYRNETSKRSGLKFNILRSIDWGTMCIPPMIIKKNCEKVAYKVLIDNFSTISKFTDADLLCLYQQRRRFCRPFISQLHERQIVFDSQELSNSQVIDTTTWKKRTKLKKRLKYLRKNEGRLEQDFNLVPKFVRYRGDVIGELIENGIWDQFKRLWNVSWQKSFISRNDEKRAEESFRFFEISVKLWSKLGRLDFCVMMLGEKAISVYLNNIVDGNVSLISTFYDAEYEQYGIGSINLTRTILDSIDRGDNLLDFGGEAVTWKRRWSTNESPILLHEIPLGTVKSAIWSVNKRINHSRMKKSRVELHTIQSKKDFESSKNNQPLLKLHEDENYEIKALKTEEDWKSIKNMVEQFEKNCHVNPWQNYSHCFNYWKTFKKNKTCWMIAVKMPEGRSKGLLALAFFLEENQQRRRVNFKVLRSLDQMAMRIAPFMVFEGMEHEAHRAILHCLKPLQEKSGADLVSLYRLDTALSEILVEELVCMGIPHKAGVFTKSKIAVFPDDFADYQKSLGKSVSYKTRRADSVTKRDYGESPQVLHFSGKQCKGEEFNKMWKQFEQLRKNSWQYENAESCALVETEKVTEYYGLSIEDWARRGMVHFTVMLLRGQAVSGLLSLVTDKRAYGLLTAYDRNYSKYSYGIATLVHHFKNMHETGNRFVEIGGEGSDWKKKWSSREEDIYQIEIGLGTHKSMLWELMNMLKRKKNSSPVR